MLQLINRLKQKMLPCYLVALLPCFTLIELLIVISVILLFSGLSLAAYNNFNEEKKLEAETRKFVEVLELAKKKVISGDKTGLGVTNQECDLIQYKVVIDSASTYFLKSVVCYNDIHCGLNPGQCSDTVISNYRTNTNINFNLASFPDEIIFNPFGLGADACQCCLLYTSPSPRDGLLSRMPSSA